MLKRRYLEYQLNMAILILKLTEYTLKYANESGRLTRGGANGCMRRYSKICKKHLRGDITGTRGQFDTLSTMYSCLHLQWFNYVYLLFTYVYTWLPMITCLYLCLLMFTYVYHCLLMHVYLCLPMFTRVYLRLPLFTCACFTMFNHVYSCLPMFTIS